MPGVSKAQRAEAKYNVVLDFPDYGLHSAAVSGNLGLVKYALDHGQPVNSALDGVLPLHAACAGGNDIVVRLLIDHGADVNAPRLPRRYSNDRPRNAAASAAPLNIVGSSGSTPLHFAASNGHTNVVLTLLLHGAHPDRPDKHGITPEMLARQNGHPVCADVLREWCHNKDKDLREREANGSFFPEDQTFREREGHSYCGSLDCKECATRKRIRMKRSIDNAIHILRHSSSHSSNLGTPPHSAGQLPINEPPSPSERPFGQYTFYSPAESTSTVEELPPRRPSLPQVLEVPHHVTPTAHRSRRPSNLSTTSAHRPRSAGNDAEPSTQRVKGKISLLNIFKKGIETPESISSYNSSSSAITSASTSPAPGQLSSLAMTSLANRSAEIIASAAEPSVSTGQSSTLQQRFLGDNTPPPQSDIHRAVSRESLRGHVLAESLGKGHSPVRPGILRTHGRSSSSGEYIAPSDGSGARSGSGTQGARSLRFDSSSSAGPTRRNDSHPHMHTHHFSLESRSSSRTRSPGSSSWGLRLEDEPESHINTSPQPIHSERCPRGKIEEVDEHALEEDEEEYGNPVEPQVGVGGLKTRLGNLRVDGEEGASGDTVTPGANKLDQVFECPFSINCPPPVEDASPDAPASSDNRTRGDSLSSMVTDTSNEPSSSYVTTPALEHLSLPIPAIASPSSTPTELPNTIDLTTPEKKKPPMRNIDQTPPSIRRGRQVSLDLDIENISSHAQAEALVQRAQQRIFDLDDENEFDEDERASLGLTVDHTPLSARLAAYGESLAIEREFKEREQRRRSRSVVSQTSSEGSTVNMHARSLDISRPPPPMGSLVRQVSFQERAPPPRGGTSDDQRMQNGHSTPGSDSADFFLSVDRSKSNVLSISNPEQMGRLAASSTVSLITPPPAHAKTRSETMPMLSRSAVTRSRTPDPDTTLSYGSSFGVPLARYQTCPTEDSMHELSPRSSSSQARQAARAQKLAKMGFSSGGDTWKNLSEYQARSQRPHRFGGIRTFVQNLTGRT